MRTKRKKSFYIITILLLVIEIISITLMYKSSNNKHTLLDNVKLKEQIKEAKGIAIMLEQSDGTYSQSENNAFPTDMIYNSSKSGCIDNNGNKIDNALSYSNGIANVETSNTTYCYLYFDIKHICEDYNDASSCLINTSDDIWDSTLDSDGYRFVGTNPDNYICFGTTDIKECTSDTDKYMYRIIGIFEDSSGNQHLKLIKKEALNTAYAWHSDNTVDVDWDESDLYQGINGSYFLTNTNYSYMQDTTWKEMITDWDYTATNVLSYENYSINGIYGPYYSFNEVYKVYLHETNRSTKNVEICYRDTSTTADCTVGEWKMITSKVSLMYSSDYLLSLGNISLNYISNINLDTLKTGWMHLGNNDSTLSVNNEWTMTRYGSGSDGKYSAWGIDNDGGNNNHSVINSTITARPVFYVNSNVEIINGSGTVSNPYIITSPKLSDEIIEIDNETDIGLQQTLITGDDLYRFSGTSGNTGINNYICLGATSCTSGSDNMYRIIGINPDNREIKVIKETPWNNKTTYAWHETNEETSWLTSDLYTNTVSKIYDELTFKDMIAQNHTWNVDAISTYDGLTTRAIVIDYENNTTGTANIGILSMTDYYLAYNGDRDWFNDYDITTNWIGSYLNGNTTYTEWTMTYYGQPSSNYNAWLVGYIYGNVNYYFVTTKRLIRPVFYLSSDVQYVDGDGSSTNPFIVE